MAKDKPVESATPAPAATVSLLAAIENAGPDDLDAVRGQIRSHEGKLASLRQIERILDLTLNGPPERKKPGPRKAAAGPSAGIGFSKGAITDKYRRDVAAMLMRGPARPAEICEECGIPNGSIAAVLSHPWFGKNTDGSAHVTSLGRQQASA